jgi:hypothetical protein
MPFLASSEPLLEFLNASETPGIQSLSTLSTEGPIRAHLQQRSSSAIPRPNIQRLTQIRTTTKKRKRRKPNRILLARAQEKQMVIYKSA